MVPIGQPLLVRACFVDPEGGALTLSASSSDAAVATVSVEGHVISVEAVSLGSATITVVATDPDALTAEQEFKVLVPNQPPVVCGSVPQQSLFYQQSALIEPCFEDPDNQEFTLSASSSDVEVAKVDVLGLAIRIRALSPGTATVAVVATDPGGLTGQLDVQVLVPNRSPVRRGSPGPAEVVNGESRQWRIGDYIQDPDGQKLTYSASSANPEIVSASVVDNSVLMVTAVAVGSATVTMTGTDPGGLSATIEFTVTVVESGPELD